LIAILLGRFYATGKRRLTRFAVEKVAIESLLGIHGAFPVEEFGSC
jgi:hypothetical protein